MFNNKLIFKHFKFKTSKLLKFYFKITSDGLLNVLILDRNGHRLKQAYQVTDIKHLQTVLLTHVRYDTFITKPHHSNSKMWPTARQRALSVCLSVSHIYEPCQTDRVVVPVAAMLYLQLKLWSMPERFEIYIVYKKRYINTLPFLFLTQWSQGTMY